MSTQGQSQVVKECIDFLSNNTGQFLPVDRIASETSYSEGHVRKTLHDLADDPATSIERDRRMIETFGVIINNNFVAITSERQQLLNVIQKYWPSDHQRAQAMSVQELQSFIRDRADEVVTSQTDKLFFAIP